MAPGWIEEWKPSYSGSWRQGFSGTDAQTSKDARVVGELRYPGFEFIDPVEFNEGRFVGYFLGLPYDREIMEEKT